MSHSARQTQDSLPCAGLGPNSLKRRCRGLCTNAPIFSLPLLFLAMRGVKGLAFALAKNVCLSVVLLLLVSVCCLWLNCFFWLPEVSNFFRHLEMSSIIPMSLSLSFTLTVATPTLLSLMSVSEARAMSSSTAKL